jgi:hypothetical protein
MTEPERIDFTKIIAEIESAGITPYKISLMMHRQFGWVQRIQDGQEPKFYEGCMLLEIHRDTAGKIQAMIEKVERETFESKPNETHIA